MVNSWVTLIKVISSTFLNLEFYWYTYIFLVEFSLKFLILSHLLLPSAYCHSLLPPISAPPNNLFVRFPSYKCCEPSAAHFPPLFSQWVVHLRLVSTPFSSWSSTPIRMSTCGAGSWALSKPGGWSDLCPVSYTYVFTHCWCSLMEKKSKQSFF